MAGWRPAVTERTRGDFPHNDPSFPARSMTPLPFLRCLPLVLAVAGLQAAPRLVPPRAGLQPDELGIVVREGDAVSEAIAEHYRQARGIPVENVVRLPLPAHGDTVDAAAFETLRQRLDTQLPARVQATLLTWVHPSRVVGGCAMSITSAFAFGYDDRRCSLGDRSGGVPSPYYDSDTTRPWDDLRLRPSMMLGAATLDEARAIVARGRAADGTAPAGDGYLVRTTDSVRSLRWPDFRQAASAPGTTHLELFDHHGGPSSANALTGRKGVMFYFTGLPRTPGLDTNSYRPGAVGDSLTSSGGVLVNSDQTTVLEWLKAGLTASYGTVEEPFAHEEKFPRVSVLLDHYQRGATLIEAYWKSVLRPGQGLFVGEPLARPYADAPRWRRTGDVAELTTRALRAGRRYPVFGRASDDAAWAPVGMLSGAGPLAPPYRVSVPARTTSLRVADTPCPATARFAAAVRGDPTPLPAARARRLVYQVEVARAPVPDGCGPETPGPIDLVLVGPQADGVVARGSEGVVPRPGVPALARVEVTLPAGLARATALQLAWRGAERGEGGLLGAWRVAVADGAGKPLRIVEPGPGWSLAGARRADGLRLPVAADVDPGAGIVRVRFTLKGALGPLGPGGEVVATGPAFAAELQAPWLPAGSYRLVAQGEDAAGAVVATAGWVVQVPLGAP